MTTSVMLTARLCGTNINLSFTAIMVPLFTVLGVGLVALCFISTEYINGGACCRAVTPTAYSTAGWILTLSTVAFVTLFLLNVDYHFCIDWDVVVGQLVLAAPSAFATLYFLP